MKIIIATPAPPGSRKGNRITALRWRRLLRQLGHRVALCHEYAGEPGDLLIALHARRGFAAVDCFRRLYPQRPIVLTLTGTDLYEEIQTNADARQTLEWATRLIVLQPLGVEGLPENMRFKARVIMQSAEAVSRRAGQRAGRSAGGVGPPIRPRADIFEVCVLGHLRPVKDPFRTALASRLLPASSRLRVLHLGAALSPDMAVAARAEVAANHRYRWLGDQPRWKAQRLLARCRLLAQTSRLEGGANTLSEAIAAGVPVLSSRIPGSVGILGADYPGYFGVGDTQELAALLHRAETDAAFYASLKTCCRRLRPLVAPARERAAWRRLLSELTPGRIRGAKERP
jgi:putative glycosyltransferase (TIGR04348 family)